MFLETDDTTEGYLKSVVSPKSAVAVVITHKMDDENNF